MHAPFFSLAMRSPSRRQTFELAVLAHLVLVCGMAWVVSHQGSRGAVVLLGQFLLVAGIVEGALLLGWRLTQLPKSQALEFLLVSPLRPRRVFLAEAAVGLGRLTLVTLSGLPLLVLLSVAGVLDVVDLLPLLVMPWTWGVVTGLGLVTWAYEGRTIRRWGERILGFLILVYLFVGVLAAEKLIGWLQALPPAIGEVVVSGLLLAHRYNPFSVMQFWLEPVQGWMAAHEAWPAWERMVWLEGLALATALVLLHRAAHRLKAHFRELHYAPLSIAAAADRDAVGDRPLSWWAVRRVMEYSGRVNLWLAGGFGVLYALFTLAGPHWPPWLGRSVFQLFNDRAGGIPAVAAALVVLAAVPAAFQYGLWDSNTQDRCRRLELLLLTQLEPRDYWDAAAAAAWRRGRGYFLVATLLWLADGLSRILAALDAHAPDVGVIVGREALRFGHAMAVATILWGLYFALGFRAFSRGLHANGLGSLLTLGVPLLAFVLTRVGGTFWGALMPPGAVYWAAAAGPTAATALGPCLAAGAALLLARHGLQQCDRELRAWYDRHHGAKVLD